MSNNNQVDILKSTMDVIRAESEDFMELIKIAGLDPAEDFQNCDLRGINLAGIHGDKFNFTGSILDEEQKNILNQISEATPRNEQKANKAIRFQRGIYQRTLKNPIYCNGIGLATGKEIKLSIHPAPANTGIIFRRLIGSDFVDIPANYKFICDTRQGITLGSPNGAIIQNPEIILAALSLCEIDNVLIEVNGPEIPVMDGSASPFVFLIECAGIVEQKSERLAIKILQTITTGEDKESVFLPSTHLNFDFSYLAHTTDWKEQSISFDFTTPSKMIQDLSGARRFGFLHEAEIMKKAGLNRGASLDNTILIDGPEVINDGGLRFGDEFVRHLALKFLGILSLAGAPLICQYISKDSKKPYSNSVLSDIFSNNENWIMASMQNVNAAYSVDHTYKDDLTNKSIA